ncbi:unnamed protein product [Sphacelaria rigidula]
MHTPLSASDPTNDPSATTGPVEERNLGNNSDTPRLETCAHERVKTKLGNGHLHSSGLQKAHARGT